MASNFDKYEILKKENAFPGIGVFDSMAAMPTKLDPRQYNTLATTIEMPPEAQAYFDRLDLRQAALHAPDSRQAGLPEKTSIFVFRSDQIQQAREVIARNLPEGMGRDNFISVMLDVAQKQSAHFRGAAGFIGVINEQGVTGGLHYDGMTGWRSLWQPSHSQNPADTTIVAHHDVEKQQGFSHDGKPVNNFGHVSETNPDLIRILAPNSLVFWTGEMLRPPRYHSEPDIPQGGQARFTLIANSFSLA